MEATLARDKLCACACQDLLSSETNYFKGALPRFAIQLAMICSDSYHDSVR